MKIKRIICIILSIVFCVNSSIAMATSTKEQQLKDKQNQISNTQSKIKQNEKEQKNVLTQIGELDNSINNTELQISQAQKEIADLEESIEITKEDIKVSQEEYDKNYELRKSRMVAYYKNSTLSLEESVSKIEDEPDKMYLEKAIERVVNYDTELINELERQRLALEEKKKKLERQTTDLANLKADLEVKLASLSDTKTRRESYLTVLENDHAALEKSIDAMKQEADRLTAEIRAAQEAAAKANKTSATYTGGKMTWPLPGSYTITSPFGNRLHPVLKVYKLHTGVDIAGNSCNGKPVVAAADGVVIVAKYSTSYGNYVVIDHGGGITTLYAHSSKLEVSVGQKVKAGQEIMKVGTTGYSTGPHLHFEVRENGTYVDPIGKGYIKA